MHGIRLYASWRNVLVGDTETGMILDHCIRGGQNVGCSWNSGDQMHVFGRKLYDSKFNTQANNVQEVLGSSLLTPRHRSEGHGDHRPYPAGLLDERPNTNPTILQAAIGIGLELLLVLCLRTRAACQRTAIAGERAHTSYSLRGSSTLGFLAGFSVVGAAELAESGERRLPRFFCRWMQLGSARSTPTKREDTHETVVKCPFPIPTAGN